MSRLLFSTGLFLLAGSALAQTAPVSAARPPRTVATAAPVTGRVLDAATQETLPGAIVFFPDLKQATTTDADGNFRFASLPRGRFLMQVRFVGYTTRVQTVDTGTGQPLAVSLTPAATEIGQVVVTGVSASTEMRRSPVPTSVVDQTRLRQTAATNSTLR